MTIINQINKYLKIIIQIYSLIIKLISNKYNLNKILIILINTSQIIKNQSIILNLKPTQINLSP